MGFTQEQINSALGNITDPKENTSLPAFTKSQTDALANQANKIGGGNSLLGVNPDDYDFSIKGGNFDNNLFRAQNQGWGEQLAKGVAKGIAKIPFEIIGSTASILDFEDYVNQDNEIGNSITRAMNEVKGEIDEALPIYAERPGSTLDIGDFAWWAENGSGLLTSATAFAATGFGVGAAISKGTSALKWMNAATKGVVNLAGTSLALNQAEGMLTAIDIYDNTYKQSKKVGKSEEEAKTIAASAASYSINVNRMNIALNMTSSSAFLRAVGPGVAKKVVKNEALKAMGLEGTQEYLEEVVNLYAEQEGERHASYALLGEEALLGERSAAGRLKDTFFSLKGLEAGLLGAVGGIAQTGLTHAGRKAIARSKTKVGETAANTASYTKDLENIDIESKKNNQASVDIALSGLTSVADVATTITALNQEADKYTSEGKEVPTQLVQKIKMAQEQSAVLQAVTQLKQGRIELAKAAYEDVAKLSIEEAAKRGYSGDQLNEKSPIFYKNQSKEALKVIGEVEKIYSTHYALENIDAIVANRMNYLRTSEALEESNIALSALTPKVNDALLSIPLKEGESTISITELSGATKKADIEFVNKALEKEEVQTYLKAEKIQNKILKQLNQVNENYNALVSVEEQNKIEKSRILFEQNKIEAQKKRVNDAEANKELAKAQDDNKDALQKVIPGQEEEGISNVTIEDDSILSKDGDILENSEKHTEKNSASSKEILTDAAENVEGKDYQASDAAKDSKELVNLENTLIENNEFPSKASALAYMVKEGDASTYSDTILKETLNKDILDPSKINVGTNITLIVDETYSGEVNYEGQYVAWQELKKELDADELVDYAPIMVLHKGEPLAHIHATNWITSKNISVKDFDIKDERNKLRQIRKAVLIQGKVTTTVTSRSNGVFFKGDKLSPLSEAMPDVKIAVIVNNSLSDFETGLDIINRNEIASVEKKKDGFTIALMPINEIDGKTQYIASPLLRQSLNEEAKASIVQAVEIFMHTTYKEANEKYNKTAQFIAEATIDEEFAPDGFNILTADGLRDYLRLFTNVFNVHTDGKSLTEELNTRHENFSALEVSPNGVAFGKGGEIKSGQNKRTITPLSYEENPSLYKEQLESLLPDLYSHVAEEYLGKQKNIPIISAEGEVSSFFNGNYTDYVSQYALHTDLRSLDIGTKEVPKRAYTINSVINYDVTFANIISEINQPIAVANTEQLDIIFDSDTTKPNEGVQKPSNNIQKWLTIKNANIKKIDPNATDEDLEYLPSSQEGITSDYILEGISAKKQNILVANVAAQILEYADSSSKTGVISGEVVTDIVDFFITQQEHILKGQETKFHRLVKNKLNKVVGASTIEEESAENQSLTDKDEIWGQDVLTINPKDKLSGKLKRIFGFTPYIDSKGDNKITKEGFTIYVESDKTYSTIMGLLSENYANEERLEIKFEKMMDRLESYKNIHPFLPSVITTLENSDKQTQNQFVVAANKHYVQMHFVMQEPVKGNKLNLVVYEDNANAKLQVLKDSWKDKVAFSEISEDLLPNMKAVEKLVSTYDSWVANAVFPIEEVKTWLDKIGVEVNITTLKSFQRDKVKNITYENHFILPGGVFQNIYSSLKNLNPEIELLKSTLYTQSAITILATQEAANNAMFVSNTHRSGNKTIYSHNNHKYASQRTIDLLYDDKVLTRLANSPATKHSSWLRKLVTLNPDGTILFDSTTGSVVINKESDFYTTFSFGYLSLNALKESNNFSKKDKSLANLTEGEHELTKLGLFQAGGVMKKNKSRKVKFFFPTMSDKSAMFTIATEPINVSLGLTDTEISTATVKTIYETVVKPEVSRILGSIETDTNIKNYAEGANIFYSIPELNDASEIWIGAGKTRKLNPNVVNTNAELQNNVILKIIKEHLDKVVAKQLKDWTKFNIYNEETGELKVDEGYLNYIRNKTGEIQGQELDNKKKVAKLAAADYTLNYLVANSNFNSLYVSDLAQYFVAPTFKETIYEDGKLVQKKKALIPIDHDTYYQEAVKGTFVNVGKRLAGLAGPGYNGEFKKPTYNQGFLADKKGTSLAIKYINKLFKDSPSDAALYTDIKATDAQEFITVPEKLTLLFSNGQLSEKSFKNLSVKYKANEDFTSQDLAELKVIQPDKPIYVGAHFGDNSNVERKLYIKSSAITLVPQFTKGLEIDKLRKLMKKDNIDRVAFSSAVKVGNVVEPLNIWNTDGTIDETKSFDKKLQVLSLNRRDLRVQQDAPVKESGMINRVTQASKLAFVNLLGVTDFQYNGKDYSGLDLQKEFLNNWETLYSTSLNNVLSEDLGITKEDVLWHPKTEKLEQILKEEAEKRDYSLQDIEGLTLLEDGSFELPLWAQGGDQKYQSLLTSLIENSVIKQKMPGKSYVLGTEEGFKTTGNTSGIIFTNNFSGELQPSNLINGEITDHQVIVAWPFKGVSMSNFIKDGKLDTSKIDSSLLKMYGMRIPGQGPNSTANLEVVGFLPEVMGETMIAPRDLITQMGSDFDWDKLYSYRYNYIVDKKGNLKPITEENFNEKELASELDKLKTLEGNTMLLDLTAERGIALKQMKARRENLEDLLAEGGLDRALSQNNIISIHRTVNSHKKAQKQIKEPLGFGKLKEYADIIENSKVTDEVFSPLSSAYQRTKYKNAVSGKDAVGVFAIANTFNASVQGKEMAMFMNNKQTIPLRITFGEQKSTGNLSSVTTIDKNKSTTISHNISAFLSSAVDNEKEQILHRININKVTYKAVNLLNQLGFTQDVVVGFLNQDIIVDFVNEVENLSSLKLSEKKIIKKAQENLIKGKYANVAYDKLKTDKEKAALVKPFANLGGKELFDLIKEGDSNTDYALAQLGMLDKFLLLNTYGQELRKIAAANNVDSSGLGKNLLDSKAKEESVSYVLSASKISNVGNLFGTIATSKIDDSYFRMGDVYVKPETFSGYATFYGVVSNNKIWNQDKYFPYTSPPVKATINKIKELSIQEEFDIIKNAEVDKRIFDSIKSYIFSNTANLGLTQPLTVNDDAVASRLLLLDEKTKNLQGIISNNIHTKYFRENAFLNKLSVKKREIGMPGSIKFNPKIEDSDGKLNIYASILELLNSDKELPTSIKLEKEGVSITTEKQLIEALIAAEYLTGGVQGYTNFLNYVPLDYLKKKGFTKEIRNIDFTQVLREGIGVENYSLPYMVVQYFQHNASTIPEYEDIKNLKTQGYKFPFDIAKFKPTQITDVSPMVRITTNKKDRIFLFNGNEYIRIDKLGGPGFKEYQKGMIPRSFADKNIAKVSTYDNYSQATSRANNIETRAITLDTATLNEKYGLDINTPSIDNTLSKIVKHGIKEHAALADDLLSVFNESEAKLKYKLMLDVKLEAAGAHDRKNHIIYINPNKLLNDLDYSKTFLHETIHLLTNEVVDNPITEDQKAAKASLNKLYKSYRKKIGEYRIARVKSQLDKGTTLSPQEISEVYPATSLREFIASFMSDPITQKSLNQTDFNETSSYGEEYERRLFKILKSKGLKINSVSAQGIKDVLVLIDYNKPTDLEMLVASNDNTVSSRMIEISNNPNLEKLPAEAVSFKETKIENPIINTKKLAIGDLERENARLSRKYKRTENARVGLNIANRIEANKNKIESLEEEITAIKELNTVEDLLLIGEKDLEYADTLLNQKNLSDNDSLIIERTIDSWLKFPASNFIVEAEQKDKFLSLKERAGTLNDKLYDVKTNKANADVSNILPDTSKSDILQAFTVDDDASSGAMYALDLSKTSSIIGQAAAKATSVANNRIAQEVNSVGKTIDKLEKAALEALKEHPEGWSLYKQTTKKGKETGRVVTLFDQSYYDAKREAKEKVGRNLPEGASEKELAELKTKQYKKYQKWEEDNEIVIDPVKLSDKTYKDNLIKELGKDGLATMRKQALGLQEAYIFSKEVEELRIEEDLTLSEAEKIEELLKWEMRFDPSRHSLVNTKVGDTWVIPSGKYVVTIPKRNNFKGVDNGYYDANFTKIQNSPGLKAFHDYLLETMYMHQEGLPSNKVDEHRLPLVDIKNSFMDVFKGEGGQSRLRMFLEKANAGQATKIGKNYILDELTEGRRLSNSFNASFKQKLNDKMFIKETKYKQKTNEEPSSDQKREWRVEITDELLKNEFSSDIGANLRSLALTSIAYKHKAEVAMPLRNIEQVLEKTKQHIKNNAGNVVKDGSGLDASEEGLKKLKAMMDNHYNKFFGVGNKVEGEFGKPVLTDKEKALEKEYNEILEAEKTAEELKDEKEALIYNYKAGEVPQAIYDKTIKEIEEKQKFITTVTEKKEHLGNKKSVTGLANTAQRYFQLLGMGLNVTAGIANIGFGALSNFVEGAGGQFYTVGEMIRARGKSLKAITNLGEGKKIRILMKDWDVLKKSSQEIIKDNNKLEEILYITQDATEYQNQAPLMIVMQSKTILKDEKGEPVIIQGKEVSFYNAYDENGVWRTKELGAESKYQDQRDKLKLTIDALVRNNHGNYDSTNAPIILKSSVLGRAVAQFRSWMFEGFASRFESSDFNEVLGVERKGRYRTLFEQNLKLLGKKNYKDMSDIDKINARKLLAELSAYVSLLGVGTILKHLAEDEEDTYLLNYLINLNGRVQKDILFYINPSDFEDLTQTTIPFAKLISNTLKLVDATHNYMFDYENNEIKYGVHAGDNKFRRAAFKMLPIAASYEKIVGPSKQVYEMFD